MDPDSAAKYWEDWEVGRESMTLGRTIFDYDVSAFLGLSALYEVVFMDREYYEHKSVYSKRISPGLLTISICEGLVMLQGWLQDRGMALLGLDEVRFVSPVAVGDTIRVVVLPVEKREARKPDRGIITFHHTVVNQKEEVAATYKVTRLIRRRPSQGAEGDDA